AAFLPNATAPTVAVQRSATATNHAAQASPRNLLQEINNVIEANHFVRHLPLSVEVRLAVIRELPMIECILEALRTGCREPSGRAVARKGSCFDFSVRLCKRNRKVLLERLAVRRKH